MNKTILLVIGISVGLTCLISTLFGFAGSTIIGTFWGWFWVTFLIQFVGFIVFNSYLIQRDSLSQQQIEVEALDKLSKFTIKLTCAYCQQYNTTPIQLNQKNTFKCESCNQVNGISMQFMATTLTSPIESVKIPIENSGSIEFKVT
jgi:hypothetical protein